MTCNWSAKGYRLPTEAEWEYSAKANQGFLYAGSDNVDEVAWYDDNSDGETHPVGQKKPNGFGLYDMSGNVSELVWDRFGDYRGGSQTDPRGPDSGPFSDVCLRGGGWGSFAWGARVSSRAWFVPGTGDISLGFRLSRFVQ